MLDDGHGIEHENFLAPFVDQYNLKLHGMGNVRVFVAPVLSETPSFSVPNGGKKKKLIIRLFNFR